MGKRQGNGPQSISVKQLLHLRTGVQARCAVSIAYNHKILRTDVPHRCFTRKEFETGLLGRKPCREARGAIRAVTALTQFFPREDLRQVCPRCFL